MAVLSRQAIQPPAVKVALCSGKGDMKRLTSNWMDSQNSSCGLQNAQWRNSSAICRGYSRLSDRCPANSGLLWGEKAQFSPHSTSHSHINNSVISTTEKLERMYFPYNISIWMSGTFL
ncbi:unnamed protein product [Caretta caretta]